MKFSRWKLGFLVAIITGIASAFACGLIIPSMTLKEGILVCVGMIAKDVLLFCSQHPWTDVEFEAEAVRRAKEAGCQSVTPCNPPATTPAETQRP